MGLYDIFNGHPIRNEVNNQRHPDAHTSNAGAPAHHVWVKSNTVKPQHGDTSNALLRYLVIEPRIVSRFLANKLNSASPPIANELKFLGKQIPSRKSSFQAAFRRFFLRLRLEGSF